MIILDTNVLSALMRPQSEPRVVEWADELSLESIWVTSITTFEVWFGIELLPKGRRRRQLEDAFAETLEGDLGDRVLTFDQAAARAGARIAAERRRIGRPVDVRDVQIAGIVFAHDATLATRNVGHFEGLGLRLVNPWSSRHR